MSSEPTVGEGNSASRDGLRLRSERLRALRSAWGVLAPSGLSAEKQVIAETGRALSEELVALLGHGGADTDPAAIALFDARLDQLERDMREVALKVSVAQLRSTLPAQVEVDRRGVLDLLDLVLSAEVEGQGDTRDRIPTLDYLITLLCTGGNPDTPLQDPVTLTPRLHDLCASSDIDYDPRLPELEAEFFGAADMHQADVREEVELRTLRRRKMELGKTFFAPRVLRAVMTYNAALLRRIDEQVLDSQDWGALPVAEAPEQDGVSVFDAPALPNLAAALRRRAVGDPPAHDPVDRIAWCLDLPCLTEQERDALLSESTGSREGLVGTAVLVGLLCRSAVVLDEEFPAIGIAPEALAGAWTKELDETIQQEVARRLASDYEAACVLSDLKNKFLGASGVRRSQVRRPAASSAPAPPVGTEPQAAARPAATPEQPAARGKAKRAAKSGRAAKQPSSPPLPWGLAARFVAVVGLAALAVGVLYPMLFQKGRVSSVELEAVSPFLASGERDDEGAGAAFVGKLDSHWAGLEPSEQEVAAEEMVQALHGVGVRNVMVYDADRVLRIQALGGRPPLVVPAEAR